MNMTWRKMAAAVAIALACGAVQAQTTELLISEYVEGSGNNKVVEIFNGTGAPVDLGAGLYTVSLFSNGSATPTTGSPLSLTGTLNDGQVLVIRNNVGISVGSPAILITNVNVANWNGDDTIRLFKNGVLIDEFGTFNIDPGTEHIESGVNTQNTTLVRKPAICSPNNRGFTDTVGSNVSPFTDAFTYNGFLGSEWTEFPQDTFSNLGGHTATCSVDLVAPNATVITPSGQGPTNADKVSFFVTFDEAVQNFDALADVVINTTGTITTSGVAITGSNASYIATVQGITGNGTITLAVSTAAAGVEDLAGNDLASSVTSAAVTIANASPASGLLLNETWTGASVGSLSASSFSLAADNGWDITAGAAVGTVQISDNAGDKSIEHVVDGTSLEYTLVAPLLQTVDASTKSVKIEYETEYNALGTNGSRQWVIQTYASAGSLDGYQVRFTGETDSSAIYDIAVIDNGVVGSAINVGPASGAQATGKRYKVTVVLTKVGADTKVSLQAENLTDGGFIIPALTQTLAGVSVDAGTTFDTAKAFARIRTRSLLDDLNISFDVTPPSLAVDGDNPLNIPCGGPFSDPGATSVDNFDGDISASVVADTSGLDVNTQGSYNVLYNVSDASGNAATQVVRQVIVGTCADTTPPVITLNGTDPVQVNCGAVYSDAGASATDNVDNPVTLTAAIVVGGLGAINTAVPGDYTVTYNVQDTAGNPAVQVTRTVRVLNNCSDATPPVITLNGSDPALVNCGDTYTDAGASATDNVDNPVTLTAAIVVGGLGAINTAVPGDYTVTYNVEDAAGNDALQVERTVRVINNCPAGLIGVSANEGDDVCLTVPNPGTAGDGDFTWTYSPTLNGAETPIPDATNADYCLNNVPVSGTGFYRATFEDGSKIAQEVTFNLVVTEVNTVPVAGVGGLAVLSIALVAAGMARRRK